MRKMLIVLCFLSACTTIQTPQPTEPTQPAPPVAPGQPLPSVKFSWDGKPDAKKWTEFSLAEVKKSQALMTVVPKDKGVYCPKYEKLSQEQRAIFWVHWVSELAKFESSHKPSTFMYECRKDRCVYSSCSYDSNKGYCMKGGHRLDGGYVVSRGLTQMSLASSIALGCDVKTPQDLQDPYKNLACAIRGMNRYLSQDQSLFDIDGNGKWDGCARYWAVCRGTNDYTRRSKAAIVKAVGKTKGCF